MSTVNCQQFFVISCTVHSHGIQLRKSIGLIGIMEIKRIIDERLIEARRIVEGDVIGFDGGY